MSKKKPKKKQNNTEPTLEIPKQEKEKMLDYYLEKLRNEQKN